MLLENLGKIAGRQSPLVAERLTAGKDSTACARHRRASRSGANGIGNEVNRAADRQPRCPTMRQRGDPP